MAWQYSWPGPVSSENHTQARGAAGGRWGRTGTSPQAPGDSPLIRHGDAPSPTWPSQWAASEHVCTIAGSAADALRALCKINRSNPYRRFADTPLPGSHTSMRLPLEALSLPILLG